MSNKCNQSFRVNHLSKPEIVDKLKHQRIDGSIMLEPRLQAYLKRKLYLKKNKIKPCITPEEQYQISHLDKSVLRIFLQNRDKKPYKPEKQLFPSAEFRNNDPRVPINKKADMKIPLNRGMFAPDDNNDYYEGPIDNNIKMPDMRDITGYNISNTKYDPRSDPKMNYPWVSGIAKYDKMMSQYRIGEDNIDYTKFNIIDDKNYKKFGSYSALPNPTFSEKSDMDTNNKIVIPKVKTNNKRGLSTYDYRMCKFIGEDQIIKDSEFETALIRGMPSNTTKSYGYRNPYEHYFQFIDDDFQNPDNSVIPGFRGGISTRNDNKALAKQNYTREIM